MPKLILQPEGSSLCGQCCVAMAAGVTLSSVVAVIGDHSGGTYTRDLIEALRFFDVDCADRLKCISRTRPVWPKRAIIHVMRPREENRHQRGHWMLWWDGVMLDPGGRWPNGYVNWKIASSLEIYG